LDYCKRYITTGSDQAELPFTCLWSCAVDREIGGPSVLLQLTTRTVGKKQNTGEFPAAADE
jgi:hypothetical protein